MPVTEMTNRQLLRRILAGQQQIQEFIVTASDIVEAATATIRSSDAVLEAATKVIAQANTSKVPKTDLDDLQAAREQLATDTGLLQDALDNVPTATATATTVPTATATATTAPGGPVPTSTATATTTATATSTAELRAAEIRDSPLS